MRAGRMTHFISQDYEAAYGADQAKAIENQILYCLNAVGFGGDGHRRR